MYEVYIYTDVSTNRAPGEVQVGIWGIDFICWAVHEVAWGVHYHCDSASRPAYMIHMYIYSIIYTFLRDIQILGVR